MAGDNLAVSVTLTGTDALSPEVLRAAAALRALEQQSAAVDRVLLALGRTAAQQAAAFQALAQAAQAGAVAVRAAQQALQQSGAARAAAPPPPPPAPVFATAGAARVTPVVPPPPRPVALPPAAVPAVDAAAGARVVAAAQATERSVAQAAQAGSRDAVRAAEEAARERIRIAQDEAQQLRRLAGDQARVQVDAARAQVAAAQAAAAQGGQAAVQAARQRAQEAQQAAQEQARAQVDAARQAVAAAPDAAARQQAQGALRAAQDQAREQQRLAAESARAQVAAAEQAARAQGQAQRAQGQDVLRAAQDLAREQERLAVSTGRAQVRAAQDAARQEVAAARDAARQANGLRQGLGQAAEGAARGVLSQTIGGGLLLAGGLGIAGGVAAATREIVRFGTDSVRGFAQFDRAMRETVALLGQGGAQAQTTVRGMSKDVLDFSSRMGVDAVGAARSLYQVISAGVPQGAAAMQVLTAAAQASIGGFTDQAVAVDGLTSVLNAYRLTAADVDRINDQMFQTVNIGKITYEQLAGGIGQVVPLASAAGIGFGELGGLIANATAQGISASQTFDGMRQAIQAIIRPTTEAQAVARTFGVNFSEAGVRAAGGFQAFLNKVVEASYGNHTALARMFGDVNALNFVLASTGPNADKSAEAIASVGNSAGAAARAAETVNAGTGRELESAGARWNRFQIEVGQAAAAAAGHVVQYLDALAKMNADQHTFLVQNVVPRLPAALNPPPADRDDPTGRIRRAEEALRDEYSRGKLTVDQYRESVRQLALEREKAANQRTGTFPGAPGSNEADELRRQALPDRAADMRAQLAANAVTVREQEEQYGAARRRAEESVAGLHAQEDAARRLQQQQEDARLAEESAQRERERGLEAYRISAEAAQRSTQALRLSLDEADTALQRLLQTPVQGTRAFDEALGRSQDQAAQFNEVVQAGQVERISARLEHRAPVLDRAAIRDAQRRGRLAEAQGQLIQLQRDVALAPVQRQVEFAQRRPELPAGEIVAGVTRLAPQVMADQDRMRVLERQAQAAQAALQDAQLQAQQGDLAARDKLAQLDTQARAAQRAADEEARRRQREIEITAQVGPAPGADAATAPGGPAAPAAPAVTITLPQTYNFPASGPVDIDALRAQIEAGQQRQRDQAVQQAQDYNAGLQSGATNTRPSQLAGATR